MVLFYFFQLALIKLCFYHTFLSYLECSYGFFGTQCKELCSGHCMQNESCDHVSGTCIRGCQDGYMGEYCKNCKMFIVA